MGSSTERGSPAARCALYTVAAVLLYIMLRKLAVQMGRLDGDISVYYHSSNELAGGLSPYYAGTRYIYPPLFAWLLAPFAQLTPVGYAVAWGLLLGGCWVASALLVQRLTGERGWFYALVPNLLLFRAIWNGWGHGQVSLLVSAMVLAFLVCERERRMAAASFWLAFAGAVKLFPLYLGALFLNVRRAAWIPLLGFWTAVLSLLPMITVGPARLVEMVVAGFGGPSMARIHMEHYLPMNHAPVPHVFQLLNNHDVPFLKTCIMVWALAITAVVLLAGRPKDDVEQDNLWVSFVLTSMLVVCPHVWMHYFTLLLFPFTAVLLYIRNHPWERTSLALGAGLASATVAFNAGAKLFVNDAMSNQIDRIGVLSVGLLAFWASLAGALIAPRVAAWLPGPALAPVPADVQLA